jgi:signal transduction histidine kinase
MENRGARGAGSPWPRLAAALGVILLTAPGQAGAVDHLEELGGPFDVAQVAAAGLEPLTSPRSLGFTGRAAWVRLRTERRGDEPGEQLLAWNWPLVDQLDVHVPDGRGGWVRHRGGLSVPPAERQLMHAVQRHLRIFRLAPGEVLDVYVRVATPGPMLLDGYFMRPRDAVASSAALVLWAGLWVGALGLLAATALWSFRHHRDRVYVDYALFCLAFGAYQLVMAGLAPAVAPWLGSGTLALEPVTGALAAFVGVSLSRRYLRTAELLPRVDGALRGLGWLSLLTPVPVAWGGLVLANQLLGWAAGAAIGACGLVAAVAAARGSRGARAFLLGFGPFALAGGWFVGMLLGLFPPALAAQVVMQGTLLLSGLAVALALSSQRRAEEVREREFLEAAVADRTRALDASVARLGAAQRLEAVGRLTAGVAHDFNNLLTAISAGVGELERGLAPDGPAAPVAGEVRDLVRRGGELTRSLLMVARRQPLEPRPVALNLLVTDLVRLLERLVAGTTLALDLEAGAGEVTADPGQLEQVVLNLVLNARDACDGRGRITVATRRVVREGGQAGQAGGEWARISVQDDGPGLDEATRARIFEPFFTTKGEGKGTGLGLSVVDGVARAHGGFVEVISAPGQGATFAVWLPAAGAPRQDDDGGSPPRQAAP